MATSSENIGRKKRKITDTDSKIAYFDELPDDLMVEIVSKLGASASCPSHFFNLLLTSKRMKAFGVHPTVLSKVSPKVFTCSVRNWTQKAVNFMKLCVQASNLEAIYTMGMILFYCYENKNRERGKTLIEQAALKYHPESIYALSVMVFNGSGSYRKYPEGGVDFAIQAALLGHIEATYELGHCFEDGYCIDRDYEEGQRLILQARAQGIASSLGLLPSITVEYPNGAEPPKDRILLPVPKSPWLASGKWVRWLPRSSAGPVKEPERHPVRRFLTEWFALRGGVLGKGRRVCSRRGCGLPETRACEFRRCIGCGTVSYCSLLCHKTDWVRRHRAECIGPPPNQEEEGGNNADGDVDDEENEEEVGSEGDLGVCFFALLK